MLPGIIVNAGMAGSVPRTAAYLPSAFTDSSSVASSYSPGSFAIGAASPDRRVFAIIHWIETSVHRTLTSVTLGGVSATIHAQRGHTGGSTGLGVAIASAIVPTGTTASRSFVFSGLVSGYAFSAITTTGMTQSTPFDTDTDENQTTTADLTSSTNVDTDGLLIAAMTGSTNAVLDSVSWTSVTEEYDLSAAGGIRTSMAWSSGLAAQTGRSIRAAVTPRANSGNDLVVVSWS